MRLSIIIPTNREPKKLFSLLKTLGDQSFSMDEMEVHIVSFEMKEKERRAITRSEWPFKISMHRPLRSGVNASRNMGIARSQGEIIAFFDDDVELIDKSHLQKLCKIHEAHPEVSAVGGSYIAKTTATEMERAYVDIADAWLTARESVHGVEPSRRLLGGNVSYKRSFLKDFGESFDEDIRFGSSETEFHARLLAKGASFLIADIPVIHNVSLDLPNFLRKAFLQGKWSPEKASESVRGLAISGERDDSIYAKLYRNFFYYGVLFARFGEKLGARRERISLRHLLAFFAVILPVYLFFEKFVQGVARPLLVRLFWSTKSFLRWQIPRLFFWLKGLSVRFLLFLRWKILPLFGEVWWRTKVFFRWKLPGFFSDLKQKVPALFHRAYFGLKVDGSIGGDFSEGTNSLPMLYMPATNQCKKSCSFCGVLEAKAVNRGALLDKFSVEGMKGAGFHGVVLPCNFRESFESFQKLEGEKSVPKSVVLNPLYFEGSHFEEIEECADNIESFVLLFLPNQEFRDLYRWVRRRGYKFRILFHFEISGSVKNISKYIEKSDRERMDFLAARSKSHSNRFVDNDRLASHLAQVLKMERRQSAGPNWFHPFHTEGDASLPWFSEVEESWNNDKKVDVPDYSVIIPVKDHFNQVAIVLENLLRCDGESFEIVLVDDESSKENLPKIAKEIWFQSGRREIPIRIFRLPKRNVEGTYRAGAARNVGIQKSQGKRILFLDADIVVPQSVFSILNESFRDSEVIQFPREMLKSSCSRKRLYGEFEPSEDVYRQDSYWEKFNETKDWPSLKNFWKYTCTYALSVSRQSLQKVGPFHNDFTCYGFEDVDLGYRLARAGMKFQLASAPVYHLHPEDVASYHFDEQERFRTLSRSATVFFEKNQSLDFFIDLNVYLSRPLRVKLRKPYYFLDYQLKKFNKIFRSYKMRLMRT